MIKLSKIVFAVTSFFEAKADAKVLLFFYIRKFLMHFFAFFSHFLCNWLIISSAILHYFLGSNQQPAHQEAIEGGLALLYLIYNACAHARNRALFLDIYLQVGAAHELCFAHQLAAFRVDIQSGEAVTIAENIVSHLCQAFSQRGRLHRTASLESGLSEESKRSGQHGLAQRGAVHERHLVDADEFGREDDGMESRAIHESGLADGEQTGWQLNGLQGGALGEAGRSYLLQRLWEKDLAQGGTARKSAQFNYAQVFRQGDGV